MTKVSLQWFVTTLLYNVREHIYNLSGEYKAAYSELQWTMISGFRHCLVHDYDETNWDIIVDVAFEEIPVLIKKLERLL